MPNKTLGYLLLLVGIVLIAVGLFADSFIPGAAPGLGWKQIVALVIGLIAALAGAWMAFRRSA